MADSPDLNPPSADVPKLIDNVYREFHSYDTSRRYRVPRYDLTSLKALSRAAGELADAIAEHGLPPPPPPSPASKADQALAKRALLLGQCLVGRADMLAEGQGDQEILMSGSGKPFVVKARGGKLTCTIRRYVEHVVRLCDEDKEFERQINKQDTAHRILQLKVNILACFNYCWQLYRDRKPPPRAERGDVDAAETKHLTATAAKRQAQAAFSRLLPAAIPFPLYDEIRQHAETQLSFVLRDLGAEGRYKPLEATIDVVQAVMLRYRRQEVTRDQVRQGAGEVIAKAPRITPELSHALANEKGDPHHYHRGQVVKNIRRIEKIRAAEEKVATDGNKTADRL